MHRLIAYAVLVVATLAGTLLPSARAIEAGNWGGGLGALVWPFVLAWLATAIVYYPLRWVRGFERTVEIGASKTQYVGMTIGVLAILALATNYAHHG